MTSKTGLPWVDHTPSPKTFPGSTHWHRAICLLAVMVLASCASKKPPPEPIEPLPPSPTFTMPEPAPAPQPALIQPKETSNAATARAYRKDAARHLYGLNAARIYKGKLPALVHAVGVLSLQLDGLGNIAHMHWARAPSHAPEAVAEIEKIVRAAAPFPAPVVMGGVIYTDIWLWDRSGKFQLDTLTEGQRRK